MRAMQIIEWGKPLEFRDYPTPEPTGEQVLVRVESAGVCHSDVHIWDGYFDLGGGNKVTLEQRGVKLPFTMGHEIAGEVVARGPEAKGVEIGKRYAVYPWIGCGTCAVCKKGDELLCLTPRTLGTRTSGGYGSHVVVPQARYLVDYGNVPQALAATYTCSGITAYSALKKIRDHVDVSDHFLIIGAGGVGGRRCASLRPTSAARCWSPTSTATSARTRARWAPSARSTTARPMPCSRWCSNPAAV